MNDASATHTPPARQPAAAVLFEGFLTGMIGAGIVAAFIIFLRRSDDPVDEGALIFFVLLLTLIITLYDRYRPIRAARYPAPAG